MRSLPSSPSLFRVDRLAAFLPLAFGFGFLAIAFLDAQADEPPQSPAPQPGTSYEYLGRLLDQKVEQFDWGGATLEVLVMDLESNITILERKSEVMMPPASLAKLFLAVAALDTLGPEHRFLTELSCRGKVQRKFLKGSWLEGLLLVRGDGDPTFSSELSPNTESSYATFDQWAQILKKMNIRTVKGTILVDESAFDVERFPPGWPLENFGDSHLPEISALNFNDNCVDLFWLAGKKEEAQAQYHPFPDLPDYVFISNNVRLASRGEMQRRYARPLNANLVTVTGNLPLRTEIHERASVLSPAEFFGHALKARLAERKIEVTGGVRLLRAPAKNSAAPEQLAEEEEKEFQSLDAHSSPPLREILGNMLRLDRTLDAEVFLKTLGRKRTGRAGSFADGCEAVMDALHTQGIRTSGMVLLDGSGMSTLDRVSAHQVMSALALIHSNPRFKLLEGCFPEAGKPGALEHRFASEDAEAGSLKEIRKEIRGTGSKPTSPTSPPKSPEHPPAVLALSGEMKGVETLAGWARTQSGHPIHFVFLVTGSKLTAKELQERADAVILEITRSAIN